MKKLIIQAVHLIKQNPFYSLISIVGTAVTIAFVMVVIMMYKFRSADIAPESDRSRLMYTATGINFQKDGSNIYSGMGKTAFESLFLHLPGISFLLISHLNYLHLFLYFRYLLQEYLIYY